MTTESEPHIIQADAPFNVAAVRTKTGRIDALAKRPRLVESPISPEVNAPETLVDPSRHITDTRARITPDIAAPDSDLEAAPPNDGLNDACAAEAAEVVPLEAPGPTDLTQPPTVPAAAADADADSDAVALSDLQRRMLDIKSNNQTVARELEALEESLRQPPAQA